MRQRVGVRGGRQVAMKGGIGHHRGGHLGQMLLHRAHHTYRDGVMQRRELRARVQRRIHRLIDDAWLLDLAAAMDHSMCDDIESI